MIWTQFLDFEESILEGDVSQDVLLHLKQEELSVFSPI
jgi:hypothetical protein